MASSVPSRKRRVQREGHQHTSGDSDKVRATASSSTTSAVSTSNGAPSTSSLTRKARLAEFRAELSAPEVDLQHLKELCFHGCPDQEGIRSTCWKLLLGYLPCRVADWDAVLTEQRNSYLKLRSEILSSPHQNEDGLSGEIVDHPLNPDPTSTWHRYFEDNEILLQIDHDARRLYPGMSFFQLPTAYPQAQYRTGSVVNIDALKSRISRSILPAQQVSTSRSGVKDMMSTRKKPVCEEELYVSLKEEEEAHWEVVERLLFLYAKTNSGIGYVQGMNEIIGPLYYVFVQHPDEKWRAHAEADTFFCFTSLMTEIGDKFTKKLDTSQAGIGGSLQALMVLLEQQDQALYKHLIKCGMDATYFAFRWITLLLSQEFLLPDIIRIWDSLFADEQRFSFLSCFCASMIVSIREQLLAGDFGVCMRLLQNFPPTDTQKLFIKAQEIKHSCTKKWSS